VRWFALGIVLLLAGCGAPPPAFEDVRSAHRPSEAYLYDRHGTLLDVQRIDFGARRLPWTPLADVSPALVAATIAAEDRRFFEHAGVDWRALGAAAVDALRGARTRGASTISMQVAARLDPAQGTPGTRTLRQKLAQIAAARALERSWSKEQILETYFNQVDFEGELAGIGAAARYLLGKSASGIDEAEAAVLAARLRAPNAAPARIARRACAVARAARFAVDCETIAAVSGATAHPVPQPALAPELAQRLLISGGQRVDSTLDAAQQAFARAALADQLRALAPENVRDGAAIVLDNATGDVLAWVGSAGPGSRAREVDGVRAPRQAGSTLKPFLYGLLLEQRHLTAASLLDDSPVALETANGLYIPQNYDRTYRGLVSVRAALAESMNVPAVRALTLTGLEAFRERLDAFGFESVREPGEFYGYSLALGSAEVTLVDLANAYRALANGGDFSPVRLRGDETAAVARRVLDPGAAFVIADILSDRGSRARAFGLANPLATRFWSAVKTGTSKDMRDNWCVGFSLRFTVAVWVGNFEGDGMRDVSGVAGAAPAWLAIMNRLHRDGVDAAPVPPGNVEAMDVRFDDDIEPPRREWFLAGTELVRISRVDPGARARIVSPPNGVVIALDPDIPADRQRVPFETRGASDREGLVLDGVRLAAAGERIAWAPTPGRHVLNLVAPTGTLDEVVFDVRAPASR
jgi:penicillin-binding protein 1C